MKKNEIIIPLGTDIRLTGILCLPDNVHSLVIFSHGSGSSRYSPRNNFVADILNKEKIATLLIDLLTPEEDQEYQTRFNIDLLTERLIAVTEYVKQLPELKDFNIGYFGASTGAASALKAAAKLNRQISAVVSRGGRPDLAGPVLRFVTAPVLLIVGSYDLPVIGLNEQAYNLLECEKKFEIVEGATHLFEEHGKLEEVAELATRWFKKALVEKKSYEVKHNI